MASRQVQTKAAYLKHTHSPSSFIWFICKLYLLTACHQFYESPAFVFLYFFLATSNVATVFFFSCDLPLHTKSQEIISRNTLNTCKSAWWAQNITGCASSFRTQFIEELTPPGSARTDCTITIFSYTKSAQVSWSRWLSGSVKVTKVVWRSEREASVFCVVF